VDSRGAAVALHLEHRPILLDAGDRTATITAAGVQMRVLRRLRGVLGIAATWGAAFAGLGVLFGLWLVFQLATGAVPTPSIDRDRLYALVLVGQVLRWGLIGAASGVAFSAILMLAERRQTLATLSPRRFARWGLLAGALGGAAVAAAILLFVLADGVLHVPALSLALPLVGVPLIGAALGRATAAATLRAARRGLPALEPADEPAQLLHRG
jgi:hypothetical protein